MKYNITYFILKLKRILFIIAAVIISAYFYNCDDAGVVEADKGFEVTGTVNGWPFGVRILKAQVYDNAHANYFLADSTTVATDGSFTLKLKDPTDSYLYQYAVPNCTGTVSITPSGLKYSTVELNIFDSLNTRIGKIEKSFQYPPWIPGAFLVNYIYFNDAATISGTTTCTDTNNYSVKSRFNVTGSKGWNKLTAYCHDFSLTLFDIELSNTEPVGGMWKYRP